MQTYIQAHTGPPRPFRWQNCAGNKALAEMCLYVPLCLCTYLRTKRSLEFLWITSFTL